MNKNRLEAFSDGVIAIIITIMVLEFKIPKGNTLQDLLPLLPTFFSYALSFLYVAIYWNNHHHMIHTIKNVNGKILWANLHLLFWLSLIPFATAWMGEQHFAKLPTMLYGIILLMNALAYLILQKSIIKHEGKESFLYQAIGNDYKGKFSLLLYVIAVCLTYYNEIISGAIYLFVALLWLVPDKRIERFLNNL